MSNRPRLLQALDGAKANRPPIWLMRQAGRYLPEYRALRAQAPDFIAFCLDPEKAAEVTLQPMRRFPLDAAIVFADILLLPRALGQEVWFETGEGPRLGPLPPTERLQAAIEGSADKLSAVGETLQRVREALEPERTLIGFAGAPWTVLTYMLEGGASGAATDRSAVRDRAYRDPKGVDALVEVMVEATWRYLAMQVRAGAQALMLFESWAEGLPQDLFARLVVAPHQRIVERLRAAGIETPVIGFPRGAGALVRDYAEAVAVQGVGLDTQASARLGREVQVSGKAVQGALDPLLLRAGGKALDARVDGLVEQWSEGPHIFNLGHGVLPDTPVEHVERVVARVTARG